MINDKVKRKLTAILHADANSYDASIASWTVDEEALNILKTLILLKTIGP